MINVVKGFCYANPSIVSFSINILLLQDLGLKSLAGTFLSFTFELLRLNEERFVYTSNF